jgi:hypothetical protein
MLSISLDSVTLEEFMDCLFSGNLRRLAREGEPTQEELSAAWEELYAEFSRRTAGDEQKNVLRLTKRVSLLEAKRYCAGVALLVGGEQGEEMLRALGYGGDEESVAAKLRRDSVALEEARRELAAAQAGKAHQANIKESFTRWINAVGKYMGFRVDRKKTSVAEFIDMDRMMKEELREANKIAQKNGR